jgi:hypothetical protein
MKISRRQIRKILIQESVSRSDKNQNKPVRRARVEEEKIRKLVRSLLRERLAKGR